MVGVIFCRLLFVVDCFQSVIEDLLCRLSITHQHQPSHIQQRPAAYQAATRAIRRWGGRIAADRFSVEGRRRQGSNEREAEAVSVLCWHVQDDDNCETTDT